jgi:lipoate---protein ligase
MAMDEIREISAVRKAPNGKLLRIKAVVTEESIIEKITITGDFFLHPERLITDMEKSLAGKRVDDISNELNRVLEKNNGKLIGCTPHDIEEAIKEGLL